MSFDYSHLEFSRPAPQIKAINLPPVPLHVFDGMRKYEDAARGFNTNGFECNVKDALGNEILGGVNVEHRPADAQVLQLYRMPADPASTELERLSYFDIGSGRRIGAVRSIIGEDWRGIWRAGGYIFLMDLDGNENSQVWRYWEDNLSAEVIPKIDGELDNHPGRGRVERLTHDGFRYGSLLISDSNRIMVFSSNKENSRDTLIYITKLIDSDTGAKPDGSAFILPGKLVTPLAEGGGTSYWQPENISMDDRYLLLTKGNSSSHRPFYVLDISTQEATQPELIRLPNSPEKEEETVILYPQFSRDPESQHLLYLITNAYGDFRSVITYDTRVRSVTHITTPDPNLCTIRPIPWEIITLNVTNKAVYFVANVEGWRRLFVMPLSGTYSGLVIEVRLLGWEGGMIQVDPNARNGRPFDVLLHLVSYRAKGSLAFLDLEAALTKVETDEEGAAFVQATMTPYHQATAELPAFRTFPPRLMRFKSFDCLEIPIMYYHPTDRRSVVPVVISIHGGPAAQATPQSQGIHHGYILNELGCAIISPNVRGSAGYGKRFMAADDVEKREDSVKDIGALLDYIRTQMSSELDPERIAVLGGSYGGYMVYSCLTHYSSKLTCGVANFGIAHWPSFLRNTAPHRRDHRRQEYGDERIPEILDFLEKISPLNNASKITVPLSIAHGENDSRVTVEEAIRMWQILSENGVNCELMVCEKEGHGYKQKSVIEFTNAAKMHFLERNLLGSTVSSSL